MNPQLNAPTSHLGWVEAQDLKPGQWARLGGESAPLVVIQQVATFAGGTTQVRDEIGRVHTYKAADLVARRPA